MSNKHCPHCNCSTEAIKFGNTSSKKQRYRCKTCCKTWVSKSRPSRLAEKIWDDFVWNNLPVRELAKKYKKSPNSIRNLLRNYEPPPIDLANMPEIEKSKITVVAMDATYFGRTSGVVVAVDAHTGKLLYFQEIFGTETNADYERCIDTILAAGIYPGACVIDGRQGVKQILKDRGILVQLCHFHMQLMMKRYLTNNPVLEPNIALKLIADSLCNKHVQMSESRFYTIFVGWYNAYKSWLMERSYNPETGRREYCHQDTRRAFNALKNHRDVLFTYEHYPELNIPRTSNRIEGAFGVAKDKLRIHHGYTKRLKIKIFFSLLSGRTGM